METLETLVRDSLTALGDAAPDAGFLPRAVRDGVVRRRREHAAIAIGAVLGIAGLIIGLGIALGRIPGSHEPESHELLGHYPPIGIPESPGPDVPAVVINTANHLSRSFANHPVARVVWVSTTLSAWYHLQGEPPPTDDARVYVIELRNEAPVTCVACKGLVPVVGRYGIATIPITGTGGSEFTVTDTDYPLWEIGTEYMLDGDF